MKNITLSLDEALLVAGREYARRHRTTLNQLVRDMLRRTVLTDRGAAAREMFRLMDRYPGDSKNWSWHREDAYDR